MSEQVSKPNIILITIDALRPDFLGCYSADAKSGNLSPCIDKLATESVCFENVIAQGPRTAESFPALLSGQFMTRFRDAYEGLSPDRKLLAEMLKKNGYSTAGFNSNPYISRQAHYDRGFDVFVDNLFKVKATGITRKLLLQYVHLKALLWEPYTRADKVNRQILEVMPSLPEPFFLWVHYMDVHGPYISKKGLRFKNTVQGGMLWRKAGHSPEKLTAAEKIRLRTSYSEEVQYVDGQIASLLGKIDNDNTAVFLTSDHGEYFGEHGLFGHAPNTLYEPLLRVPLLFRPPAGYDVSMRRIHQTVQHLDIVPTVLDLLGLQAEHTFDGESLLPLVSGADESSDDAVIFSEIWTKFLTVRKGSWKLIANFVNKTFELYDLEHDPGEDHNVATENIDKVGELREIIINHLKEVNAPEDDLQQCDHQVDEAVQAQLKALGYM